jgi:hypothetical protein
MLVAQSVCSGAMRRFSVIGVGLGLWSAGACGPGLASRSAVPSNVSPSRPSVRPGVAPPSDERGFRALLIDDVMNGGLWFADSACQAQFGPSGTIRPAAFDAFAHCIAGLHVRPTGRADSFDDTSVLTDDAGFEIEARVANGRLDFIGFSGRAPGAPDLPSITNDALESLRLEGDRNATISADDAKRIAPPGSSSPTHTEHLRLCLTETGELGSVAPATTTTVASAAAFTFIARTWKFRPFLVGGTPMPVCSIVGFQYPATSSDADRDRLPPPPELSKAGHVVYTASPLDLEKLRVAGTKLVVPDDEDKIHLNGKRLVGSFKLCLDEGGHYERGELLQSTGVPTYDAKIVRTMMQWRFQPYVIDGTAFPVCTAVTFIYTQR